MDKKRKRKQKRRDQDTWGGGGRGVVFKSVKRSRNSSVEMKYKRQNLKALKVSR